MLHHILALALFTSTTFGLTIHSAKLDPEQGEIIVKVIYQGSFKKHSFQFNLERCNNTPKLSCLGQLTDITCDPGNETHIENVHISLAHHGLDQKEFSGAQLTLYAVNPDTKSYSSSTLSLPKNPE